MSLPFREPDFPGFDHLSGKREMETKTLEVISERTARLELPMKAACPPLVDVEERAARLKPLKSFEIPSRSEREDLWPGDLVKLGFWDSRARLFVRAMWVRCADVLDDHTYVGILETSPLFDDIRRGDEVLFSPENVVSIDPCSQGKLKSIL